MILFLTKKWLIPKQAGSLRELSFIFVGISTLCSFLSILAIFAIQFLYFITLSSFMKEDFHLSFPNTQRNIEIWKANKQAWEQKLHSKISQEMIYAKQQGILFHETGKFPISIQAVPPIYFSSFRISFAQGEFNNTLPSIVLSEEIAFQLNIGVRDIVEFSFLRQTQQDEPISVKLIVTGILKSMPGDNPYIAFAPLSYFGDWLRNSLKTGLLLENISDAPLWKHLSYAHSRIVMNDIFSRHYNLLFSFQWEKILLYFLLLTIVFVSCIIIYISFSIIFRAYGSQWALLRILGLPKKILLWVFCIKTISLVLLGFSVGLLLSLVIFLLYFSMLNIPWSFFFSNIIQWRGVIAVFCAQILLCSIAFALPIFRYYDRSLLEELNSHD